MPKIKSPSISLSREQRTREAVLLSFCDPVPAKSLQLLQISDNEWKKLLQWLDTSGLALYFLERMVDLQLWHALPRAVFARLKQNLIDNAERTRSMIAESLSLQSEFQRSNVSYATLKGFSLYPHSVPRLELRSQLDLDFLVAEKDIPSARQILEHYGYHLHAVSGRSWEFKTDHIPNGSLGDLYKNVPHRCVELHAESSIQGQRSLLGNSLSEDFHGIRMPVLSPPDLFLEQGAHLFKHVCSESSRAAHLIEFRRHVVARRHDTAFWNRVRAIAERNPRTVMALGVGTLLISRLMGDFAPEALTSWTADRLPFGPRLWIELYGHRCALADFRGTKLYLLLQRELESVGFPFARTLGTALVPRRLPPPVTRASANDTLKARIQRQRLQSKFIRFRLRFHLTEGIRYIWESFRWRRYMSQFTRIGSYPTSVDVHLLPISDSFSPTTKE